MAKTGDSSAKPEAFDSIVQGAVHRGWERALAAVIPGDRLAVKRERDNKADHNAIALYNDAAQPVGYVMASVARVLAPRMDAGWRVECIVREVYNSSGPQAVVNLFAYDEGDADWMRQIVSDIADRARETMTTKTIEVVPCLRPADNGLTWEPFERDFPSYRKPS